jgi:hypothetical protein
MGTPREDGSLGTRYGGLGSESRWTILRVFRLISSQQAEEHARKRIKLLLPQPRRSPSPLTLPHLRSPSPPLTSPYPPPAAQHLSYASFVMDKAVTRSFRSSLLDELEQATNGLIEGEATMRRALGRLWQVISEDPDRQPSEPSLIPKMEDEADEADEQDPKERRLARAPDLTPSVRKIFVSSHSNGGPSAFDSPEAQLEILEKSLGILREHQDDGREYTERLQEIREGLGEVRGQRNGVWDMVREKAIKELQGVAFSSRM